jgi:acyl carrier protein
MEKGEVLGKLSQIIVSVLKHDRFEMRDDLTAADVDGWDSLTHMAIITDIEEAFNIKFKLKELNKLKNMGTLIDLIQSKITLITV